MPEWVTQLFNGMIGGGAVAGLVAILDFRLRDKWKHDCSEIDGSKVSLIAEAEAAKAKQDLKKSIALRYAEIEFERLVELEKLFSHIPSDVVRATQIPIERKTADQTRRLTEKLTETMRASERAGMFLSEDMKHKIRDFLRTLIQLAQDYVGPQKPVMPDDKRAEMNKLANALHDVLRGRIRELRKLKHAQWLKADQFWFPKAAISARSRIPVHGRGN